MLLRPWPVIKIKQVIRRQNKVHEYKKMKTIMTANKEDVQITYKM